MGRRPGYTHTPETLERLRTLHIGRKRTPEARKRMSDAAKARWDKPEYRAKVTEAILKKYRDPIFLAYFKESFPGRPKGALPKPIEAPKRKRFSMARAIESGKRMVENAEQLAREERQRRAA